VKAVVVRRPGGIEVLSLEQVPDPVPGPNDVVVEVAACGVCFHDIVTRNGTLKAGVSMPCILGHEIAGTVVATGREVRGFKPGDRVASAQRYHICGACRFCRSGREPLCPERKFLGDWGMVGGYAQYVAIEDDNLALVPDGVPLAESAITACAIGTIYNAITAVGALRAGESVLVTGAGGAYVVAQTTSPEKEALARELGAHAVVVTARGADFSAAVKAATGGQGVDVAIDNVGSPIFDAVRKSFGIGGRWLLIGQLTGQFVPFNPAQLFLKNVSMLSATSTTRRQLEECLQLVERRQIRPIVSRSFALAEAAEAHRLVEEGRAAGRLLLRPNA
jgi:acryloyl-coenzyme A reductase